MKVLVVGGHGFVGGNICEALNKTEHVVICQSRRDGLDLSSLPVTTERLEQIKPDAIINCAAHVGSLHYVADNAATIIHDNMQMALNLYMATSLVSPKTRIINPLSNCSYPGKASVHHESDWWMGEVHESIFSYGNSKRFTYVLAKCYEKQCGINSVNFLVPNTFGPGDTTDPNKTHAINGLIIRMLKAQKHGDNEFEIWGTGRPIREWGYIDDVVNIIIKGLLTTKYLLYPVNIAQNEGFSIKQSAKFIANAIGYNGNLVFNTNYQDGAPSKLLDDTLFRDNFPDYKFINHKDAIKHTVDYYKRLV